MTRLSVKRDLGLQLLALYLLFVGPVIIAALIFDTVANEQLQRDVKAADLALARSIALETDVNVQNALRTVNELTLMPEVQSMDKGNLREIFSVVIASRSEVNLVYILDAKGIMVYHYPEGPINNVGNDFSFRQYYKDALTATKPLMSEGRNSPTTNQFVTTAVMPLRDKNGNFVGLIGSNVALSQLSTALKQIVSNPASGGLRVSILDELGQIIADPDPSLLITSAREKFRFETGAALRGESDSVIERDAANREWLRSYVPIPTAGWVVLVQRPTDIAFASPGAFHNGLLIAIGIFLAGGLFFWMMLSRRVIAPLERLATFSAAISQRSVAPSDRAQLAQHSSRLDQMGHLIRALTQMEHDIERRFTELSTLLDTSTAVVSTLDSQKVLDTILEQVQRLLNVDMCAIITMDERAGELRLRASRGLSEEYVRRLRTRALPAEPNTPSWEAINTGQLIMINDTESDSDFPLELRKRARAEGYRAVMAAPLITRHSPPSALIVYWHDPHICPIEEINLAINFANHAAMAIENSALFALTDEKLREQTRTLEALVGSLNDGLILENSDGRILYCNRRICELAEIPFDEMANYTADSLRQKLLSRAVEQEFASPRPELSLQHNGRTLDLRLQSFDVTDERGDLIGRGQLWLDVTGDKELDRIKSTLIATVSHELRTPLAAIKGNITSLLADDIEWDKKSQREFLEVASAETDRLSELVTDLLDLSKIQAGTFVVNREPCAIAPLAAHAANRARPNAGKRLTIEIPPNLPIIHIDPPRIEAVLRNLIENAVKYSPVESPNTIHAAQENNHLVVRVSDHGVGIPEEHRQKVFDRFYRIDSGLARQTSGAGLGLAICKGFVEAHGGHIQVAPSERGTVFEFALPIS
ncbi:MAG: GAF domain-containing protein [Chloroflexi bacterium]|nr:GAF domain-containing protein [Chloroflexota bacterium]